MDVRTQTQTARRTINGGGNSYAGATTIVSNGGLLTTRRKRNLTGCSPAAIAEEMRLIANTCDARACTNSNIEYASSYGSRCWHRQWRGRPRFFTREGPACTTSQSRSIEDAERQEPGEQQIAFDLRKPLAPQLDSAKDYLTGLQREYVGDVVQARHHKRKWPLYLRVIDARDDKETWERIFDALLAGEVSADAGIEASDRLIDQGASAGAAKARQVWEQARELMFKLTA
ncbi:MAG: hypothetical protein WKH97_03030 [Casimicrobiaceae bacterium]